MKFKPCIIHQEHLGKDKIINSNVYSKMLVRVDSAIKAKCQNEFQHKKEMFFQVNLKPHILRFTSCTIWTQMESFEITGSFNSLKHSVSGPATLTQNFQLLKYIPEILNDFFTFIFFQIAFTVLGIGLFLNSGRISA